MWARAHFDLHQGPYEIPITGWAVLGFPGLVLAVLAILGLDLRRRRFADAALPVYWLATVLWVLLIPCLSDGAEGNRMRVSIGPLLLLCATFVVYRVFVGPGGPKAVLESSPFGGRSNNR